MLNGHVVAESFLAALSSLTDCIRAGHHDFDEIEDRLVGEGLKANRNGLGRSRGENDWIWVRHHEALVNRKLVLELLHLRRHGWLH